MHKIGPTFLAVLVIVSSGYIARAQDAVSPARAALAKEIFTLTAAKQSFNETLTTMMSFEREQAKQVMSDMLMDDKTMSPSDKAQLLEMVNESSDHVFARCQEFFAKQFNFDKFVDDEFVPLYAKHFSEAELRDIIAFYRSPTGQKAIEKMPVLMADTMAAFSKIVVPKLTDFMRKAVDEEMAALKQKLPKRKLPPGT